jgi:hypothetical protein
VSNEELEASLQSLLAAIDPVPDAALQAAYSAIGWRNIDSELAQLTSDTAAEPELAHVRGRPPRLLTFRSGELTIALEVSVDNGVLRLLGQLDPPRAATVTVQSATSSVTTQADARGRFSVDAAAGEWMRVVVGPQGEGAGGERATTEWFRS